MPSQTESLVHVRPFVPFPENLVPVFVVRRHNRFVIEVTRQKDTHAESQKNRWPSTARETFRETTSCPLLPPATEAPKSLMLHMPNTGRMSELLTPGTPGLAVLDGGGERKTAGTLLLVRYNGRWVSVDARMPNRLFEQCLIDRFIPAFRHYDRWRGEAPLGEGRIDFQLSADGRPDCFVETKSCNLVEDGLALFPDAPTTRGARHLAELADAARSGRKAAVVWFVQRDDARRFAPHHLADPDFAKALRDARAAGVAAYAYRCRVSPQGITVLDAIPVEDA